MSDRGMVGGQAKEGFISKPRLRSCEARDADAVVSAGHTGASVAAGTIKLGRARPSIRPGSRPPCLDRNECLRFASNAGANIDAPPRT